MRAARTGLRGPATCCQHTPLCAAECAAAAVLFVVQAGACLRFKGGKPAARQWCATIAAAAARVACRTDVSECGGGGAAAQAQSAAGKPCLWVSASEAFGHATKRPTGQEFAPKEVQSMQEQRRAGDHMCCVVLHAHINRCSVAVFAVTALTAARSYAASVGGFSLPAIVTSLLKNLRDLLHPKGFVSEWLNKWQGLASLLCLLQH